MFENANVVTTGIVSATTFYGDGSQLTGIVGGGAGGVRVEEEGNFVGAAATVNFVGSAVTASFANSVVTVSITIPTPYTGQNLVQIYTIILAMLLLEQQHSKMLFYQLVQLVILELH